MTVALYRGIANEIISQVKSFYYQENEKLPSERALALKHNVSRSTIRCAIYYLEQLQYVYSVHGSGTFIKPKTVYINLNNFYSFDVESAKYDFQITNEILEASLIFPEDFIREKMGLTINDKVHKIVRLRSINNLKIMLQTHYISHNRFPVIETDQLKTRTLYEYLQTKYAVSMSGGKEFLQAFTPTKFQQEQLNIQAFIPCIRIQRLTQEAEHIIEFTDSIIRGDKYAFEINL
ncbi:MAG: GntR family transcriptional regulator [Culicoidibacterales bacterium]